MLKWNLTLGITALVVTGCASDIDRANISAKNYSSVSPQLSVRTSEFYQYSDKEVDLMARTLWAEARGQTDEEMTAVANVIVNRVLDGRWGSSVTEVIMFPYAFSCHNKNDRNYRKMRMLDNSDMGFVRAERISKEVLQGRIDGTMEDIANGATHYHARYVSPRWANRRNVVASFSGHVFYSNVQDYKYEILASNGQFDRSAIESYVTTHHLKRHRPYHHRKNLRKKAGPRTNSIEIVRAHSQGRVFARK